MDRATVTPREVSRKSDAGRVYLRNAEFVNGSFPLFHVKQTESFGKRLEIARNATLERFGARMTQKQLGERLGVSDKTVSAWESGAEPPLEMVAAAAEALGVTPGWLAFGQEPREAARRKPYERQDKAPTLRVAERKKRP